jgi:hypothetical protein
MTTSDIFGTDLAPNRSLQLREVVIDFAPYIPAGTTTQALEAQLVWVNIDGTSVPMTRSIPLSTTNRTTLRYRLPKNLAEMREANDAGPLVIVVFSNRLAGSALAQYVQFSIQAKAGLGMDFTTSL